jgi:hypothetical protein
MRRRPLDYEELRMRSTNTPHVHSLRLIGRRVHVTSTSCRSSFHIASNKIARVCHLASLRRKSPPLVREEQAVPLTCSYSPVLSSTHPFLLDCSFARHSRVGKELPMPRRLITTIKAFIYSDHRNEKGAKSLKVRGLIRL